MDDPEATAERLRSLGCTQEQVARHLKQLAAIAHRKPKVVSAPKPADMSTAEIDAILSRIAQGSFFRYRLKREGRIRWAGNAVLSVLNLNPDDPMHSRRAAEVLVWLGRRGLIGKGCKVEERQYVVTALLQPPRIARTRLRQANHGNAGAQLAL